MAPLLASDASASRFEARWRDFKRPEVHSVDRQTRQCLLEHYEQAAAKFAEQQKREWCTPLPSGSGREDSNLRPQRPERCALPGCATPRDSRIIPRDNHWEQPISSPVGLLRYAQPRRPSASVYIIEVSCAYATNVLQSTSSTISTAICRYIQPESKGLRRVNSRCIEQQRPFASTYEPDWGCPFCPTTVPRRDFPSACGSIRRTTNDIARVAQWIERHRPKVGAGGSNPSAGARRIGLSIRHSATLAARFTL